MRGTRKSNYGRRGNSHSIDARENRSSQTDKADGKDDGVRRRESDGSLRQCASCGCSVPSGCWTQHVNGIRHRRNQASVALHGEPGHLVRSIFESDPADIPDSYRGKDPIAQRPKQLRQLMASSGDDDAAEEDRELQQHQQMLSWCRNGKPPAAAAPSPPRHRRPHSEAFAEQQARREARLLGGGAAAQLPPMARSDGASSSSGDDSSGSGSETSSASSSSSDSDSVIVTGCQDEFPVLQVGGGADGAGEWRSRPLPLGPMPRPPTRRAGVSGAGSTAAVWAPGEAQISALVAAARREAVHHTGLGPLYGTALGLLDAGMLRRGAAELRDRLWSYRQRLEAWLLRPGQGQKGQGQQQTLTPEEQGQVQGQLSCGGNCIGVLGPNDAALTSGAGAAGGMLVTDVGGVGAGDSDSDTGSDDGNGSSDSEGLMEGRAWRRRRLERAPSPEQAARRQPRRPYLRLGPAELLLLSIHPAVAGSPSAGANSATTATAAAAFCPSAGDRGRRSGPNPQGGSRGTSGTAASMGARQDPWKQQQQWHPSFANRSQPQLPPAAVAAAAAAHPSAAAAEEESRPLRQLFLEVPFKPHGREAAAYATAVGVVLGALRRAAREAGRCPEELGLRFSRGEYLQVVAQGGAARLAPLEALWQLPPPLVQLMQACPGGLRELRLCCPPGLLDAAQLEDLIRAAGDTRLRNQRRLAVLMGSHARLGSSSPLRLLPREVLELLLESALPRNPVRLVLSMRKWVPRGRQQRGRRGEQQPQAVGGQAANGAAAGIAAADVWAAPEAPAALRPGGQGPGPDPGQAAQHGQQQQLLPLDVRVAARHAARR